MASSWGFIASKSAGLLLDLGDTPLEWSADLSPCKSFSTVIWFSSEAEEVAAFTGFKASSPHSPALRKSLNPASCIPSVREGEEEAIPSFSSTVAAGTSDGGGVDSAGAALGGLLQLCPKTLHWSHFAGSHGNRISDESAQEQQRSRANPGVDVLRLSRRRLDPELFFSVRQSSGRESKMEREQEKKLKLLVNLAVALSILSSSTGAAEYVRPQPRKTLDFSERIRSRDRWGSVLASAASCAATDLDLERGRESSSHLCAADLDLDLDLERGRRAAVLDLERGRRAADLDLERGEAS
ncbi:hypothetical protein CRG98_048302 [Punica granatum]|uniref:Uncharacterized protein n=1 Tax=Punica granatum TaxID=22663 RepID=A0A2I0HHW5_PUNGR|nr:hypothetical protein CRG98_048302 [Punica granatum]